jgi:signal transduction histidine kinase
MATAARGIHGADLGQRLPGTGHRDELEDLRKEFNGLLDRVQESFEKQKRFSRDASHQLRTPLAAMLGQIEVALRRERPSEEYKRVLTLVETQANRLRHIIETLLFLAQVEVEAPRPELQPVDFGGWLNDHLKSWPSDSRPGDINVDCRLARPAIVNAHPLLLGQLLDNLLDNACKYSRPGTSVIIRVWCEASKLFMSVEDAGCGISAEDLPHVFEPFYRSGNARRLGIGGVGLGLAVARQITIVMCGRLTVTSTLGEGGHFTLELPLTRRLSDGSIPLRRETNQATWVSRVGDQRIKRNGKFIGRAGMKTWNEESDAKTWRSEDRREEKNERSG